MAMARLPDDALVVYGGRNMPENFVKGSGVVIRSDGSMDGVSVNCAPDATLDELTMPIAATDHPGIRNGQIGVTSVGKIRAAGGDVVASPSETNAKHATLIGLTPEKASELFRPTLANPAKRTKK
jgi:hypothetical protein